MTIAGDHPETGLRFVLERPRDGGPPWHYRGAVYTPTEKHDLSATIEAGGEVVVQMSGDASVAEKVRLLLRTTFRQAKKDGDDGVPSRKIVRWRGEK